MNDLEKLKQLTELITSNGYLSDQTKAWRYAFDSVKELVCITNPDLKIKYINKPLSSKLNIKPSNFINKNLSDVFPNNIFSVDGSTGAIGDNSVYYGELYVDELDGWYERYRYYIEDEEGTIIGYTFMLIDVTVRKKASLLLEEKENRFRELYNNMASGVAVYKYENNNFTIIDFNNAALDIENVKLSDIKGRTVTDIFPPAVESGFFDILTRVAQTGSPENFPVIFREGKKLTGWRDNYIYKLPSGEVVALYTDETERKQQEEALRENEKLLKGILDAIPDVISVQDDNSNVINCNIAAKEYFKLTSKDIEEPYKKCYQLLGRTEPCEECQTRECKTTKKIAKMERFIEELDAWFDCRSYPILDDEGNVTKVIEHLRDISDLKAKQCLCEECTEKVCEKYKLLSKK